ncbi:hypothetical protein FDP41_007120 [Naegleria fowleri]|uniref:Uncharacterized protein n=1 Tax=Naegleria fowleri TaxID=5763 RepID=A0A6A5B4N0_NAEFO|nr:uncharacterized protein FDP41_007120 [Naegleria fowleri]KAF0973733.1 hypothetical protein FDP41_007120 [Naegleria fowleri]CAG4712459.1 unnamed protein product [Naegleria fowleri]
MSSSGTAVKIAHVDLNSYTIFESALLVVTLFQFLYVIKHILIIKRYYTAAKYEAKNMNIVMAMIYIIVAGEGGGILSRVLIGKPSPFISNDFRLWCGLGTWIVCSYILFRSTKAKETFAAWLNHPLWKYILVIPNEARRAIALCVNMLAFLKIARAEGHASVILFPAVLGFISACGGGLMMNGIEAAYVTKNFTYGWRSFMEAPTWKLKLPFVCALYYALSYYYLENLTNVSNLENNMLYLLAYNAIYVIIAVFVLLPILTDLSSWILAPKSPSKPVTPPSEKKSKKE